MKIIFHFIFLQLLSLTHLGLAQNLVPNPSFEQINDCNLYFDQIEKATGWKSYHFTPDVFHACSESAFLRTPSNTFDVQTPATGKGYAGILTYHWKYDNELIGAQLLQPLQAGKKYEVKLKVSRAAAHARFASNNLGVLFSNDPEKAYESRKYHVLATEVIEESDIWYEISAVIRPEQNYAYIVIGNFFPKKETTLKQMESGSFDAAYYFIDDVSVVAVSEEAPLSEVAKPIFPESQPEMTTNNPPKKNIAPEPVPQTNTPAQPSIALSGTVYDAESKTPLAAEVQFYVPNTKIKETYEADYRTGQYAFTGIAQKSFVLEVSARNYYTITESLKYEEFSRFRKDVYLQPLRAGQQIPLREVAFEQANANFDPAAFPELNRLVQILKDNPRMKVELGGYTDNKANLDLSRARAEAVKKYLVEVGEIDPSRISTKSYYQTEAYKGFGTAADDNVKMERIEFKILN